MKASSIVKLLLTLVVIAALTCLMSSCSVLEEIQSLFPWSAYQGETSVIEYQAVENGNDLTEIPAEEIKAVVGILKQRATNVGYTEADITYAGNGRFRVKLRGVEDPYEASKLLGQIAKLTFTEPDGTVVIDGNHIKDASYQYSRVSENGEYQHYVSLEFNKEGKDRFAEATGRLIGQSISINLDDAVISAPMVQSKITEGSAVIAIGSAEDAELQARNLASLIKAGQIPFGLEVVNISIIES